MRTGGQTERHDEANIRFRNSWNAPKNLQQNFWGLNLHDLETTMVSNY